MDIKVTGRHLEVTDELRETAIDKFSKAERFHSGITSIEVILKDEDRKKHCEVIIHTKRSQNIVVDVARDEVLEAIDVAVDKAERSLRKLKEKTVSARRKAVRAAKTMTDEGGLPEE